LSGFYTTAQAGRDIAAIDHGEFDALRRQLDSVQQIAEGAPGGDVERLRL